MNLLNVKSEETNVNLPKFTGDTFVLRNNYYVVFNGELYNYYPIKLKPVDDGPLIRFERNPPVILEGYAMVGRKVYLVTVKDLQRSIIRKSREIQREAQNATSTDNSTNDQPLSTILNSPAAPVVLPVDEQGLGEYLTVEVSQAADLAWQDQIRTLLNDPYEEEGLWEIEDPA